MRFRLQTPPPAFDRRIFGYLAVLAVVVIAFLLLPKTRQPRNQGTDSVAQSPEQRETRVVDDQNRPLAADEFLAPPDFGDDRTETGPSPRPSAHVEAEPQLDPALFAAVRDHTLGIRAAEADAYFAILDHARRVPESKLEQAARPGVQHVNLMTDPDRHRGELITITGELARLTELPSTQNDSGVAKLYEAWVIGSEAQPYRIVAANIDPALKPGEHQRTPVRVTGYFFKQEGYEAADGVHVAPTLLAQRIVPQAALPATANVAPLLLGFVIAVGLILAATLFSLASGDRQSLTPARPLPAIGEQHIRSTGPTDHRSVHEQLRELSERDRAGQPLWGSDAPVAAGSVNGRAAVQDEYVELPTPFPPTRVSRPDAAS